MTFSVLEIIDVYNGSDLQWRLVADTHLYNVYTLQKEKQNYLSTVRCKLEAEFSNHGVATSALVSSFLQQVIQTTFINYVSIYENLRVYFSCSAGNLKDSVKVNCIT